MWRLLGSNNRELGRSVEQYVTVEACQAAIHRLRELLASEAPPRPSFSSAQEVGSVWWWTVEQGTERLASAARTFSRQRECRSNYDQFVANSLGASPVALSPLPKTSRLERVDAVGTPSVRGYRGLA